VTKTWPPITVMPPRGAPDNACGGGGPGGGPTGGGGGANARAAIGLSTVMDMEIAEGRSHVVVPDSCAYHTSFSSRHSVQPGCSGGWLSGVVILQGACNQKEAVDCTHRIQ
jgi:hypothetical protein